MATQPPNSPRRRRRYSIWTLLAPAALVIVVVVSFNAIGRSGVLDDDKPTTTKSTTKASTEKKIPTNSRGRPKARHKVAEGETLQSIADLYGLSVDQLTACNANNLPDPQNLQIGQFLHVDQKRCKAAADDGVI